MRSKQNGICSSPLSPPRDVNVHYQQTDPSESPGNHRRDTSGGVSSSWVPQPLDEWEESKPGPSRQGMGRYDLRPQPVTAKKLKDFVLR